MKQLADSLSIPFNTFVLICMFVCQNRPRPRILAVTIVGRGCGTWGLETQGDARTVDARTRGLGYAGSGDSGTRGLEHVERENVGTRGCLTQRLEDCRDKQTTPDFCPEFAKYNFRCSRGRHFTFSSARERADFNKSCNPIGSWKGLNFLIRTATASGISAKLIQFGERISGYHQFFALFTLSWTINQRKFISSHFQMAREVIVSKFNEVF